MSDTMKDAHLPPLDPTRSALDFIQSILLAPAEEQTDLTGLLAGLSAAFSVRGAGVASFPEGTPVGVHQVHHAPSQDSSSETLPPWREQPDVIERLLASSGARTVTRAGGGSCLITVLGTPERGGWLLWLEDTNRTQWSEAEETLLVLAGQVLTQRLTTGERQPAWVVQLERALRRQRMETAARLVRRLAHDFGNVLTGILGFSELALAQQLAPSSPLHSFLTEIHRGAQNGAQYTNQLRLFARRQAGNNRSCNVAVVLAEEEKKFQELPNPAVQLSVTLPPDLPAVAVEHEALKQALEIVLENAREAIAGSGSIDISVQPVQLSAVAARELFGDARPGPYLEIRVADSGSGLSAEAQRLLFVEPFFSTKPRKRGFGLAMAYGIVSAHRGGLELRNRPGGGALARLLLPVVAVATPGPPRAPTSSQLPSLLPPNSSENPRTRDRILVVDDDPMILQLVATTLERSGYRVQTVGSAEEAFAIYRGAANDPFRLVLSDVLMPEVNGVDLARRLLAQDANVCLLFMSGQVSPEIMNQAFGSKRFEVLCKPFRPETLIRTVRTTIDRAANQQKPTTCSVP